MAATTIGHIFPGAELLPTGYYGYPTVGSPRRIKPTILGVIHITDGYGVPTPTSTKSWTFVVTRDGHVIQFMDPVVATPWTNGDVNSPDMSNPLIAAAVKSDYNMNEFCFVTIENVGAITKAGELLTDAQIKADRAILQWASELSGIPMDRTHVIGHYQINGVSRQRCPTLPTDRARVFGGILNGVDEMTEWTRDIVPARPMFIAKIEANSNFRYAPRVADGTLYAFLDHETEVTVIGTVKGEEVSGNDQWLVYVVSRGLRVVWSGNMVGQRPLDAGDDAALEEAKTKIAELEATVQQQSQTIANLKTENSELKPKAALLDQTRSVLRKVVQ